MAIVCSAPSGYPKPQDNHIIKIQRITKLLTIETTVHLVMITFALVSLGNVSSFMREAHGTELVAWALGAALGTVLVVTAVMLTRIDRTQDTEAFWTLAVIVGVCAGLSGTIQFWAYSAHMPTYQAAVFGFGLPVIGEALLAYGASIFHEADRRRRIRLATEGTAEAVASAVADALSDVDVTKVRKYVERRVDGLTRAIVDGVIDELMPVAPAPSLSVHTAPSNVTQLALDVNDDVTQNGTTDVIQRPTVNADEADFVQQMADGKRTKSHERRTQLLHILRSEFDGVDADGLNKTALAGRLDVTRQTISRDLSALRETGLISMNGVVKVIA